MTSPSVVILTEPANCALADGQLLLQAVLQAQELSREGLPVSQAFCDNPAAAASFIEAYTNAFAGLQLQSPDLPLPEQLYSMLVDGRMAPLPGLDLAPEGATPAGGVVSQPLVVLSLGPPDALMQALQGNRFAKRNINVVEIAPVDPAASAAVPVAAAVAAHALAGASWSPEASASSEFRDDEPAASADAPLRLDSAEFNLNYIETDDDRQQSQHNEAAATIINAAAELPAAGAATGSVHADARGADDRNAGSPASQPGPGLEPATHSPAAVPTPSPTPAAPAPTPAASAAPEPILAPEPSPSPTDTSDAHGGTPSNPPLGPEPMAPPPPSAADAQSPSPTEPAAAEQGTPSDPPLGTEPTTQLPSAAADAETPSPTATSDADEGTPSNPLLDNDPAFQPPAADADGEAASRAPEASGAADDGRPDAEQVPDRPGETTASPAPAAVDAGTSELEQDLTHDGSSFSDPDEDVVYPPTGSFTTDDDLPYPLPLAAAPEAEGLGGLLWMGMADDIVDFEAMSFGGDHAALSAEPFDPILMGGGGPSGPDRHGYGPQQDLDPDLGNSPTPHRDGRDEEPMTPVHDLDL